MYFPIPEQFLAFAAEATIACVATLFALLAYVFAPRA